MNKSLFSQHFLDNRLAEQIEWQEEPRTVFAAVRTLWQKAKRLGAKWNEAQTEDEFIKPVLALLHWHYIPQATTTHGRQTNRPDYALFGDAVSKDAAYPFNGEEDAFYSRVLAVAEAKRWQRPLSKKDADGRNDSKGNSNPSHQMVAYLVSTRVEWGILTNGVLWRLYSRAVSSVASEYYEVDLAAIFDDANLSPDQQLQQFRRWWLFFRRAAFALRGQGQSFVQRIHEGSASYARRISEKLKEIVFADVMPEIAGGFVTYRQQELKVEQESDESLGQIYQASLSLLYKLLFLLYAEARNLLPMESPGYREQSLRVLAEWAAQKRDAQQPISRSTSNQATPKYAALLALCHRVDRGDPDLSIPRYNGGLFSPDNPDNQFLASHRLSDSAVATAIDLLVRDKGEPVDYAYISVRNLGAIYEGLLENKLRVLPSQSNQSKVELINDKGERKASGSYYTPDYIVAYIVRQTLDPILDERSARFAQAMQRCVALRQQLQSRLAENVATNRLLRSQLEKVEHQAREAFLGIKVCDPAMGSGHFLVNAVDHLTDGMIQRLQAWHNAHSQIDLAWNPIYSLIERVRRDILAEMARQGIAVDAGKLDDTALLTRLVMKRCVYGVDLNKMAVELAKLSLWLHSFTIGAPLSFLDHHLRWGNSLIGSDVRTVEKALLATKQTKNISKEARLLAEGRGEKARDSVTAYQSNLFGGPFAGLLDLTAMMVEIVEQADSTLADVHQSAEKFSAFQASLLPYKQALDIWVSRFFGNAEATEFLETHSTVVLPVLRGERKLTQSDRAAINQARQLYEEKRFFHWDLEFPEVFIDLEQRDWAQNPGFDAVIGNPPWKGNIDKEEFLYLKEKFNELHQRLPDTAKYFFGAATSNLCSTGYLGQILPNAILFGHEYTNYRRVLFSQYSIKSLINLGDNVFNEVTTPSCITISQKIRSNQNMHFIYWDVRHLEREKLPNWQLQTPKRIQQSLIESSPNYVVSENTDGFTLLAQLYKISDKLLDLATEISLGVHTGANEAFIISSELAVQKSIEKELLWPLVTGGDVDRYLTPDKTNQLIVYIEWKTDISKCPNALSYLSAFKEKLLTRREASQGKMPWYALHWARNRSLYSSPKLMCRQTSDTLVATVDAHNYCALNTLIIIRPDNAALSSFFLAAVLNSCLMKFIYELIVQEEARVFAEVKPVNLRKLPIRHIKFTTPIDERTGYVEQIGKIYQQFPADDSHILALVDHHLAQQPEQSDVVHDLLAWLAEQMIELNKQKQAEMQGWLTWLQRQIGVEIDTLPGKTTLQNYLGDYQKGEAERTLAELLAVLGKNKRKLKIDPVSRSFQEAVEREYSASLAKLLPIKQQLARTDRLIDQIVYRLYGLTPAEIALVEGKG